MRAYLFVALLIATPALAQSPDPTTRELLAIIREKEKAENTRIEVQERANSARFEAQEKAVIKAEVANEKRLDAVNEFRGTLKDQQQNLVTRTEVDIRFKAVEDKISLNNQQITQLVSRAEGAAQLWGVITVGIGLLVAGLMLFVTFRKRTAL